MNSRVLFLAAWFWLVASLVGAQQNPVASFQTVSPTRVSFTLEFDGDLDAEFPTIVSLPPETVTSSTVYPRILVLRVSEDIEPKLEVMERELGIDVSTRPAAIRSRLAAFAEMEYLKAKKRRARLLANSWNPEDVPTP